MCSIAPRVDSELLTTLVRLDDPTVPIAESYRRSREAAAKRGVPRPSYESFRILIHEARRERARRKANRDTIIRVALYLEPPDALMRLE
jgi:hypothetical protein